MKHRMIETKDNEKMYLHIDSVENSKVYEADPLAVKQISITFLNFLNDGVTYFHEIFNGPVNAYVLDNIVLWLKKGYIRA
jgi:hypothetical protein